MKFNLRVWIGALGLIGALGAPFAPAQSAASGKGEAALAHAATANTTLSLVFYREWDAPSVAMAHALKAHAEKHPAHAAWNAVQVTDSAEKGLVDRFKLSRAPMPMAITIHPNGAVTGFFPGKVAEAELARTLVSPKKAECMKALQENQLIFLCVQTSAREPVPQGVLQFQANPHFAKKTKVITALATDAGEAAFLAELKMPQHQPGTVFMAPPGVLVGRFPITATGSELGAALHASGKCCDDKNCKHKH